MNIVNFTDLCDLVCNLTELTSTSCKQNSCPINISFVVADQIYSFDIDVTERKSDALIQITCEIIAAGCVSK